jgi:isoleucyl-tRNA synthetase
MKGSDFIDVWFDSGAMPYDNGIFHLKQAMQTEEGEAEAFPADFIAGC